MNKIQFLSEEEFFKKYKAPKVDLIKQRFFSKKDVEDLQTIDLQLSKSERVKSLVTYFRFSMNNPSFIFSFIIPQLRNRLPFLLRKDEKWMKSNLITDNNFKARVVSAFKPKSILEIGTYLGVGTAVLKYAAPSAEIFTMNPKENSNANNPIERKYIGYFYKVKKMSINQIYADSTKFNFKKLKNIDLTFIDGNHAFDYVYSDLINSVAITQKIILLDDYIPKHEGNRNGLVYGPWTDGVVRAADKFLAKYSDLIRNAYWIKNSKYCVLQLK